MQSKSLKHNWFLALGFFFLAANSASAETLLGGVSVNDALPRAELRSLSPSLDKSIKTPLHQDCICFDRNRVEAKVIDGHWKIVDGDHWILDFASSGDAAATALNTIKTYKMNEICFVGRNAGVPMMYFLSDGQAPAGKIEGEDSIAFDNDSIKAELIDGRWKLTCGNMWMKDFGSSKESAEEAVLELKYYGFKRQCFVGRPGAPMEYFAR
ncbi:MAG: hypothetical protein K2X27_18010 [Candidatus Obscuribacterales bacterium]|nr:hypothetical protein [Candidatus Obscuribacterales bacterium]